MKKVDVQQFIGIKINRLTCIGEALPRSKNTYIQCLCDCGNEDEVQLSLWRSNKWKSCGCLALELSQRSFPKHGLSYTVEYSIWAGMMARCYNKDNRLYHRYGGRGIKVCDRWKDSPKNFVEDMGLRPNSELSIDRINNDGNYESSNCRWATFLEQQKNKSKKVLCS